MVETLKTSNRESVDKNSNNKVKILTEASGKFDADEARRLASKEKTDDASFSTSEEQKSSLRAARAQLKKAFEKEKSRYESEERSRVERIKTDLKGFDRHDYYERRQIPSRPGAIKKAIRLIADRLGIKTKRSEKQREGEAIYIALSERAQEEAARKKALEEKMQLEALKRERGEAKRKAEAAQREKEAIAQDMAQARENLDSRKRDRLKKQRIQELVERDLNSRLLTVDDLEIEVSIENPEVQKRVITFEGADIPVYDLKGIPFSMLSTTIDYRKLNKPGEIGTNTYKEVLENPAIWAERRDKAEKASGFGTRNADARGDTICASYWNSERNINSHVSGNLIYGFEHIEGDSIILIHNGDGGTSNMAGRNETSVSNLDAIKRLEGAGGASNYDEVLLRRYTENGMPRKPDYIITEDGRITEEALRHAKYFKVPILNVERSAYAEKAKRRGEELLESINENDSYEELDAKIAELQSMSKYKNILHTFKNIGRASDIQHSINPTPLEKKCLEISRMEQIKRLDFIEKALEEATMKIETATERGISISQTPSQFDLLDIYIYDVNKQTRSSIDMDTSDTFYSSPGNCSHINIDFKLKGSSRRVTTGVYDGERVLETNGAYAREVLTEEDINHADSSFYDTLEPVVRRYFEAYRRNQQL